MYFPHHSSKMYLSFHIFKIHNTIIPLKFSTNYHFYFIYIKSHIKTGITANIKNASMHIMSCTMKAVACSVQRATCDTVCACEFVLYMEVISR